ncbi:MAG TPA: DUF6588 family protein [bacterium]
MKRSLWVFLVVAGVFGFRIPNSHAQYFQFDGLQNQVIEDEVDAILKFFNSIVGGGMFHTADLHNAAGIDVGLRGVVANVPEKFNDLPVFSEENLVGLAFLHGSIGLPANLELFGRFFYFPMGANQDLNVSPPRAADSRGGITLVGGGLKYGLLQRLGVPHVTLMGAYHAVIVPEEFDFGTVGTLSFKAVASHSLPIFTFFVGAGVDITRLKLHDQFLNGDSFTNTEPHLTLGLKFNVLPLVHVNGAYNIGEFNSIALGLGISIR